MSTSEVGNESNNRKRSREASRSVVVEKTLRKEDIDRLIVKFDPLTGKAVGKTGTYFTNMIPQFVRSTISPRVTRWKDVPKDDIEVMHARLGLKFDYPRDNIVVMDQIEKAQMKALRDWRCEMKKHWKGLGREQNKEARKRTPYKSVDPEDWKVLCDFFGATEQEVISTKNTENRKQRRLEGGQGSKSIVAHVYDGVDPVTGSLPSVIDTFEKLHSKGPDNWRNDFAAEKHGEMVQMRDAQQEEGIASNEINEDIAPKHLDIMTQVLGRRSRYYSGYGPMPRLKAVGGDRLARSRTEKDKVIDALQKQVATLTQHLGQLCAQVQKLAPGFQFQQTCESSNHNSDESSHNDY